MATNATMAPQAKSNRNGAQAAPAMPFIRASRQRTELGVDPVNRTLTASAASEGPLSIPALGFLRYLVIEFALTGGNNGLATVDAAEDAPFSAIDRIELSDVNGNPIFGPMPGYSFFLACKYGGYMPRDDARSLPDWVAVDTEGDATWTLRIPVEISGRDALGALANQNASQTYKLKYTVAPASEVYDTEPDTLPALDVTVYTELWQQPRDGSPVQLPPAHGTTQRWTEAQYNINAGRQTVRLAEVGNMIRALVMAFRTTAPARSTTNWPDPIRLEIDGSLIEEPSRRLLRNRMAQRYELFGTVDAAGGLDTGVMVWDFAHDLDGKVGWEMRDLYLPTTQGTRLDLIGEWGAAGTLSVLTNHIAIPAGASPFGG